METYKFGNKIKCIIRAHSSCEIGNEKMTYNNQPYTVLSDVNASITYRNRNSNAKTTGVQVGYRVGMVDTVRISNVLLTDKILNLIYKKSEVKLCNISENCDSDEDGNIYLSTSAENIYQVFIYDDEGQLESAYGHLNPEEPIIVNKANSNYIIFYSYEGKKTLSLDKTDNLYLKLDLEIKGNINDNTKNMWIHLDKCVLQPEKNLYFNNLSNTVDLTFQVIENDEDYITFD